VEAQILLVQRINIRDAQSDPLRGLQPVDMIIPSSDEETVATMLFSLPR
jgi:hypothetical protein